MIGSGMRPNDYPELEGHLGEPTFTKAEYVLANGGGKKMILAILVIVTIMSALVTFSIAYDDEEWEPIGEFPLQTITVVTNETITVVGTKCYNESVTVRGEAVWQSVPSTIIIPMSEGVAIRDLKSDEFDEDGCITQTFDNPVPKEVLKHPDITSWVMTGFEEPVATVDGDPKDGVPNSWTTAPFQYPPVVETVEGCCTEESE